MSELRMRAYYYEFTPTGVDAVDRILSAVACAGKAYHHTEQWNDDDDGPSLVSVIQKAADDAASQWPSPRDSRAQVIEKLNAALLADAANTGERVFRIVELRKANYDAIVLLREEGSRP